MVGQETLNKAQLYLNLFTFGQVEKYKDVSIPQMGKALLKHVSLHDPWILFCFFEKDPSMVKYLNEQEEEK